MAKWFKFYGGEYLSDPKIERLSPLERSCWLTLLCMASMNEIGKIEFLTIESLLNRSGIQFDPYYPEQWEKSLSVLVKFKNLKMIDTTDDGTIIIKNWEKRQEHNLTVAERVYKHRQKKKNVTTDVTNVTSDKNRIDKNRTHNTESAKADIESKPPLSKKQQTSLLDELSAYEELNPGKYPVEMLREFCDYWSQRDKQGRELWTTQKAFEIPKRLATWANKSWRK